ncbi:MAG: S41 family peptidase [Taibaiella sp.]|nr:S41 family peptidase [Taibaiella sp.]
METNRRDGNKVWTPLLFSLVLIFGMVIGFNLRDSLRNKRDITTVIQRNDRLEELIGLINEKYVDTVNTNTLYKDAVTGLLEPLDPHTIYIPSEELQNVNEGLEGGFSGIGVEFSILRDTVEVTSVVEKGPAAAAGLVTGDQIIKVEDSLVAGTGITSEGIVSLLKGNRNSNVTVTIKEINDGRLTKVTITRDQVPLYSVDANIMLDDKTGYIKINRFSATTYNEFTKALAQLKRQGASQMIIDLRDNPGGYLDAATNMSDDFLDDDKLIVYTKGKNSPRFEYKSTGKGAFEAGKLAVLVDESSASASEVFAGSIQDWDRGVIIGRRTYGKGLVQEQYEMPDGSALRLTTARYYTPSGRSIQRSFAEGKDAYHEDFEKRLESGELTGNESFTPADTTTFLTAAKRPVYGGGGIRPDVYVPYDTSRWSTPLSKIAYSEEMRTAIWDYFIHNRRNLKFGSITDFQKQFNNTRQVVNDYLALLDPNEQKTVQKHLHVPEHEHYLHTQVKAELAKYLFKDNGYYSVKLKDDNVVNKALAVLNSERYGQILQPQQKETTPRKQAKR